MSAVAPAVKSPLKLSPMKKVKGGTTVVDTIGPAAVPGDRAALGEELTRFMVTLCRQAVISQLYQVGDGMPVTQFSDPLTLQEDATVAAALRFFNDQRISGCPVVNAFGLYMGWLDYRTLVDVAMKISQQPPPGQSLNQKWRSTRIGSLDSPPLWTNSASPVLGDASMFSVLEEMATGPFRHHGQAIVADNFIVCGVVTPSMFVKYIHACASGTRLKRFLSIPLARVNDGIQRMVAVKTNDTVSMAFEKMISFDVSGVVVVDDNGIAVDVVTTHDLRMAGTGGLSFKCFNQKVNEFKAPTGQRRILVTLTNTNTLREAVAAMVTNKVKRVIIINDKGMPVNVVTVHDVLRELIQQFRTATA